MVAVGDAGLAVDALCEFERGDSIQGCGAERGVAGLAGVGGDWLGVFCGGVGEIQEDVVVLTLELLAPKTPKRAFL